MAAHVRKGDLVIVRTGSAKGQTGEILRIDTKHSRVFVKGVNLRVKHLKPTQANPQGGIVQREAPIHISNVSPSSKASPPACASSPRATAARSVSRPAAGPSSVSSTRPVARRSPAEQRQVPTASGDPQADASR